MPREEDEQLREARATLGRVTLESFSATPATIGPWGGSLLSWRVNGPTDRDFTVRLNQGQVPRVGTRSVSPQSETKYTLTAHSYRATKTLGSQTVGVDLESCATVAIPEVLIQQLVENDIHEYLDQNRDITLRTGPFGMVQPISVDVSWLGIAIKLKFRKHVNNRPNPNIDVDGVFVPHVRSGELLITESKLRVDIWFDQPFELFVDAFDLCHVRERFEHALKEGILERVRELVEEVPPAAGGRRYHSVRLLPSSLEILTCPE